LLFAFSVFVGVVTTGSERTSFRRGLMTRKNTAATAPTPSTSNTDNIPTISGSFDFFAARGGGIGTLGVSFRSADVCCAGTGALETGAAGAGRSTIVRAPVGPVSFGSTAVGAVDEVAIVAPKSVCVGADAFSITVCESGGGVAGGGVLGGVDAADERKVAFGSKGWSATNKPPSMVQNF
jgi:hypothetical protein